MIIKMNSFVKDVLLKHKLILNPNSIRQFRTKGVTIGKPPGLARSIKDVLQRAREKDESVHFKVDIGLPYSLRISKQELAAREQHFKNNKQNKELANLARQNELEIPLDEVFDEWEKTDGPAQIKKIADHYAIYDHLFGDAFFYPVSPMTVAYDVGNDECAQVYYGNQLKPNETKKAPFVKIESKPDTFHTLILCNLDGHLNTNGMEYVHWFIGNIPEGDISKGETIYEYLPPFPTKGTGYHRLVFVLYEQTKKLDYSAVPNKEIPKYKPDNRNFQTYDFYKDRQDVITPVSLCFFQCDWDQSVTNIFHNVFKMGEPRFEYEFRKNRVVPQKWFPIGMPFNTYLDRYRDPKSISKEVLLKKLKDHHPFVKPDPPLKYPHAHSVYDCKDKPSWLQTEIKKERLGWGKKVNDNLDILYPERT